MLKSHLFMLNQIFSIRIKIKSSSAIENNPEQIYQSAITNKFINSELWLVVCMYKNIHFT